MTRQVLVDGLSYTALNRASLFCIMYLPWPTCAGGKNTHFLQTVVCCCRHVCWNVSDLDDDTGISQCSMHTQARTHNMKTKKSFKHRNSDTVANQTTVCLNYLIIIIIIKFAYRTLNQLVHSLIKQHNIPTAHILECNVF
jgi:hypothetical protein